MRVITAVLLFLMLTVANGLVAKQRMFVAFAPYDDEGYMLITLWSFLNEASLYDEVFTQYGPFYYAFWGGLFSLLDIPVTHDAGRIATFCVWIFSGAALGIMTWRRTRSIVLGLLAQMAVFETLSVMVNEPMHPGGLICLLLVCSVLLATSLRKPVGQPAVAAVFGALIASLILVKINVGGFTLIAAILAAVTLYPAFVGRRWLRLVAEIGFVAAPCVLMLTKMDQLWVQRYAFHVGSAALGMVIALRAEKRASLRSNAELAWFTIGLCAAVVAIMAVPLATGTSIASLLNGIIWQPLRQADAYSIPLSLPTPFLAIDCVALATAIGYTYVARSRRQSMISTAISIYSICVGAVLIFSAAKWLMPFSILSAVPTPNPMGLVGFAWVALVDASGTKSNRPGDFSGPFLPALAILQVLHAYPVAASQVGWASFLLMPVGAICIGNGFQRLSESISSRRWLPTSAFALVGILLLSFLSLKTQVYPYFNDRMIQSSWLPISLPGSTMIRIPPEEAALYREIVSALDKNCTSTTMLPGMNSFYLWASQTPPTGFNATAWPSLFSNELQIEIVSKLQKINGLCLLRNTVLEKSWARLARGQSFTGRPLIDFLNRDFQPLASFGSYQLLIRREGLSPKSRITTP